MEVTRREFCKRMSQTVAAAGAMTLLPRHALTAPEGRGRVVVARNDGLLAEGKVNKDLAAKIIADAVMKLTGCASAQTAWAAMFKPNDKVGIKVNCLGGKSLSPQPDVVLCLVDGLKSAGVPEANIIIWDRSGRELEIAGYRLRTDDKGLRCMGTDQLPGGGYEPQPETMGSVGGCLSKFVTTHCTAFLNVGILKDHYLAGVSVGMKNFYGAIHNPNKYHDRNCDPYVADICAHPVIKDKLRLVVCDAIRAQYNGGPAYAPQWAWKHNGLLFSRDPVAIDRIGAQII
ncbi:MAG: DUF362 domain-containing protein, partial [Planctomycetes bacterium]|nr:DUF362 domain-containing protein [Planctomycetota bacterium]